MLGLSYIHKNDFLLLPCRYLLRYFKVKHTVSSLKSSLSSNLEYPNALALIDVLGEYGIESAAIRKRGYNYEDFETPFLCPIQYEDSAEVNFAVVTEANSEFVTYFSPQKGTMLTKSISYFESIDKDIIILLDASHKKDEVAYALNRKSEKIKLFVDRIPFILIGAVTAGAILFIYLDFPRRDVWIYIFYILTSLGGLVLSALLIMHEIDARNPFFKEVCGSFGAKSNCDAVLSSKGAKFLNISWSVWGFSYFSTFFVVQVFFAGQSVYTDLWVVISLVVTPYIIYSLIYQWKVVKQWCPLCLGIQGLLLTNAIVALGFFKTAHVVNFHWFAILSVAIVGLIFAFLTYHGVTLFRQANERKDFERKWKKLHYNPVVFQSLLEGGDLMTVPPEGLGLVIGNPAAESEIVKVCNPYCAPCSKAHPELESIITKNENIRLRIIFNANGDNSDSQTAPVAHFLAIEEKFGPIVLRSALEEWYLSADKNYHVFALRYPMNGELERQRKKIIAMRDWCSKMKIRVTPTIFVNGKEVPENYEVNELKKFL